jgi:hypothetical protein
MVTPSRRPSWSRAAATWTCFWVSTPTVTRTGSRCAMVVLPSFLLGRVVGPAGRADNTATSLVATGSYQVTPLRSVLFAAAEASSRQVLSQAPGRWGQGSDPRHDRARDKHGGHGRPTGPKPGIPPVAYRVRSHRDHRRDHRSGATSAPTTGSKAAPPKRVKAPPWTCRRPGASRSCSSPASAWPKGPADLQTMLHEAIHALADVRGVKDTSRGASTTTSASSFPSPANSAWPGRKVSGRIR